jgi:hypothetical protein
MGGNSRGILIHDTSLETAVFCLKESSRVMAVLRERGGMAITLRKKKTFMEREVTIAIKLQMQDYRL